MGFESRHRGEAWATGDSLADSLTRDHGLERERARELLRRAELAAAEDPQARPVQQWFAFLVEGDARGGGGQGAAAAPLVRRETLVMRAARMAEAGAQSASLAAPRREPGRLDAATQWRMSQAFGFDFSGVSIRRDSSVATGRTRAVVKDGEVRRKRRPSPRRRAPSRKPPARPGPWARRRPRRTPMPRQRWRRTRRPRRRR